MSMNTVRSTAVAAATAWDFKQAHTNGTLRQQSHRADSYFGCDVFNQRVMRERLPKDVYKRPINPSASDA